MRTWIGLVAIALLGTGAAGEAAACGPDTDCMVGERHYRIALPDAEGPYGAILFMHGYRGTADGVMNNASMRKMANELGVALIAAKSASDGWLIRNAPRRALPDDEIELTYFDAVLEDASRRFPIDRDKILAAGFSGGGMMTWTLACHRASEFAAFLPIAGTFWAPIPETCPGGAADVIHINGTADDIVPVAGRPIADTRQGDVREAIAMFAREEGYKVPAEVDMAAMGLDCDGLATDAGAALALCLHDGGHSMSAEWIRWAYETFVESQSR